MSSGDGFSLSLNNLPTFNVMVLDIKPSAGQHHVFRHKGLMKA